MFNGPFLQLGEAAVQVGFAVVLLASPHAKLLDRFVELGALIANPGRLSFQRHLRIREALGLDDKIALGLTYLLGQPSRFALCRRAGVAKQHGCFGLGISVRPLRDLLRRGGVCRGRSVKRLELGLNSSPLSISFPLCQCSDGGRLCLRYAPR
jgi:hypothetical protein